MHANLNMYIDIVSYVHLLRGVEDNHANTNECTLSTSMLMCDGHFSLILASLRSMSIALCEPPEHIEIGVTHAKCCTMHP